MAERSGSQRRGSGGEGPSSSPIPQRRTSQLAADDTRRTSSRYSGFNFLGQDDFTLEPLGVTDGFAPPTLSANADQHTPSSTSQPALQRQASSSVESPRLNRSSISKGNAFQRLTGGRGSLTLRHEPRRNSIGQHRQDQSSTSVPLESVVAPQSTLDASSSPIARTQSPYQGPSGPTHPYGMYPQGTVSRTTSMATNSTITAPERIHTSGRPQHPYGMYPQNTVPEDEPPVLPAVAIPVGFPGLSQPYQRRLGPEGEEAADIIGPDGHTEQLPPYTKYPDDVPRKVAAPLSPVSPVSPVSPISPLDPTMQASGSRGVPGVGPHTFQPGPSQETMNPPQSRLSTRSVMSDSSGARLTARMTPSAAEPTSNRNGCSTREKWAEKRRRRVCFGKLPLWACCLLIGCFVVIILMGAIIGGLIARKHRKADKWHAADDKPQSAASIPASTVIATVTTTYDARPLATPPPGLPRLPTGNFLLGITSTQGSSSCLKRTNETGAWGCDLAPGPPLQVQISDSTSGPFSIQFLSRPNTFPVPPRYGAQPPILNQAQKLSQVMDIGDPSRGPSWFFLVPYPKVVILRNSTFAKDGTVTKRTIEDALEAERQLAERDDDDGLMYRKRDMIATPGHRPWYCYWNNTILEGFIYVTQNSSKALGSSLDAPPPTASDAALPSGSVPYPKKVKLVERRMASTPTTVQPYCQQMQVLDDLTIGPAPVEDNGPPTKVWIDESPPPADLWPSKDKHVEVRGEYEVLDERGGGVLEPREAMNDGSCKCIWLAD